MRRLYIVFLLPLFFVTNLFAANMEPDQLAFEQQQFVNFNSKIFETTRFVHQEEAAIMGPDSPYEFMVTTPLRPCIGVVIRHGVYTLFTHLSSNVSPKFFGVMHRAMVRQNNLSKEEKPSVLIYSAGLDNKRFVKEGFAESFSRHLQEPVKTQSKLMESLRSEIATQLDIDRESIRIIISDRQEEYNGENVAQALAVSKNGLVMNASFDKSISGAIDNKIANYNHRFNASQAEVFGKKEFYGIVFDPAKIYPPYMLQHEAPAPGEFADLFQTLDLPGKAWPTYENCSACQNFLTKSPLQRCGQCKAAYYCHQDCQKAHWRNGHKQACKK